MHSRCGISTKSGITAIHSLYRNNNAYAMCSSSSSHLVVLPAGKSRFPQGGRTAFGQRSLVFSCMRPLYRKSVECACFKPAKSSKRCFTHMIIDMCFRLSTAQEITSTSENANQGSKTAKRALKLASKCVLV